jgi:hypothetical protein
MNIFKQIWFIDFVLFCGVLASFVTSSAYPFVLASLLAIVLNNTSCIAIVLITPVLEGFLNLDLEVPVPVETLIMALLAPIIIWNCILKAPVLYNKALKTYVGVCLIIILGTFVALEQRYYAVNPDTILLNNLINLLRILFCVALSYFLVTLNKKGLMQGFKILQQLAPWLIILITGYYLINGEQKGPNTTYLIVGNVKHGEFSGAIVAFSVFAFFNIYNEKTWLKKLLNIISIVFLGYLIFQLGSKNGLISLVFVIVLSSYYFFIKGKPLRFVAIIIFLSAIFYFVYKQAIDTPTMQRLTAAQTSEGIDVNTLTTQRYGYWIAGINAFLSPQCVIGYGSTPLASRWITGSSADVAEENVFHNTPLEFAIQFGIFGLALYCIIVYSVLKFFILFWKMVRRNKISTVVIVPFLCFFSLTMSGMFLSWQWESYWWYQTAIIFAIAKLFLAPAIKLNSPKK